ncbi:MAG: class I SAM-dependent methyltransferase [Candidatus Peregrinibacteria bacterium]
MSKEKLRKRQRNCRDRVAMISHHIPLNRTCDIGCGEGLFLAALREKNFLDPMGIEPNVSCVSFGQNLGLTIRQGTIENCPDIFSQSPRDVVTLFHVIEHLVDPFETMEILHSSLQKGAFLVIETPNIRSYSARRWGEHWRMIYRQHLSYFSPSTLRLCLEHAGFTVVAEGKTDFDRDYLPWGEILFRLGLRKIPSSSCEPLPKTPQAPARKMEHVARTNILKGGICYLLSKLVGLLGRRDYIWVIAQVP